MLGQGAGWSWRVGSDGKVILDIVRRCYDKDTAQHRRAMLGAAAVLHRAQAEGSRGADIELALYNGTVVR